MNQNFQIVQTVLILGLCLAMAFMVGRSDSPDPALSTNTSDSSSTFALMQIRDYNDRLRRLEEKLQSQDNQLQNQLQNSEKVQKFLNTLSQKIHQSSQSGEHSESFQKIKSELETLQSDFADYKKMSIEKKSTLQPIEKMVEKKNLTPKEPSSSVEHQATSLLGKVKPDFLNYLALKRYSDARYKLSNFPKKFQNTHAGREATQLLKQVERTMEKDYEASEKMAEDYVHKGQIENALRLLQNVKERFPGRSDLHNRALEATKRLEAEWKRIGRSAIYSAPADKEIKSLILDMGSDDLKISQDARKSLFQIGERAIYEIRKATESESSKTRWGAVVLLGQLEDRGSEHILITALRDNDPQVRHSALDALEKTKSYKAVEEIIKVVGDKDIKVAKRAIKVFESITEHAVTLKNIAINSSNIQNVKEMMSIYWEKNRGKFLNS